MFSIIGLIIACLIHHSAHGLPDGQIIGGNNAPDGKYPYQVSLKDSFTGRHLCGGVIVSNKYVLTAAHCLDNLNNPGDVRIDTGSTSLSNQTTYTADELILYSKYNKTKPYANDIALIKLSKNIIFNTNTKSVQLTSSNSNFTDTEFMVTGWGRWGISGPGWNPDRLQEIKVTGCSQEVRQKYTYITDSHICTLRTVGEGICEGDAGGALIYDNKLVGIMSFHEGTCANGNPDVFTKVFSYKSQWLNNYINTASNQQLNILFGLFTTYLCIYSFL